MISLWSDGQSVPDTRERKREADVSHLTFDICRRLAWAYQRNRVIALIDALITKTSWIKVQSTVKKIDWVFSFPLLWHILWHLYCYQWSHWWNVYNTQCMNILLMPNHPQWSIGPQCCDHICLQKHLICILCACCVVMMFMALPQSIGQWLCPPTSLTGQFALPALLFWPRY